MSNYKIKKLKVSNFSLTLQIILINLFVIFISFILFGFFNFYSISRDLSIEDRSAQLTDLSNILVKSIVNNAIKVPLYSTDQEVLVQKSKEELEPYAASIIVEVYQDIDSEIKIYDSKLNLIINSEYFAFKNQIKEVTIDDDLKLTNDLTANFYGKLNSFFSSKFINFWYLYNKKKFNKILVSSFNETIKITEVIKHNQPLKLYYTDEKNSILIKIISPLLKNDDIYGVVVLTGQFSDAESIIANLSSNLLNNLLVTMVIVILLSIFFARSIVNPIRKLSEIANQYKKRDTLTGLKQNFPKRADEIGQLSANLKEMSDDLFERIEELEKFAADVSHELKNPLASIRSASEVLQKSNIDSITKDKLISIINKDSVKMNKLITDISNYTRARAEVQKSQHEDVNIYELLNELTDSYNNNNKNIFIKNELSINKYTATANYEKLAQVLSNIIDNAISFSPKNSSILIKFKYEHNIGKIYILDQGPGINHQYHEKIFERFYSDRGLDKDYHSGLGLDISKHIIESYRGRIYLDNIYVEGYQGACFVVELPLKENHKKLD